MRYNEKAPWAESGMVLLSAVMFLSILALAATTAFIVSTTEMKIGGNYRLGEQAYYNALAGCEEAMARLRKGVPHPIVDAFPGETRWRAYIGNVTGAKEKGFDGKIRFHHRVDSLSPGMGYAVEIRHQTDGKGHVLFWGDTDGDGTNEKNTAVGGNIYLITSSRAVSGLQRTIQIEAARIPRLPVLGALSVRSQAVVLGSHIHISGMDRCGSHDVPGIAASEGEGVVTVVGGAEVIGAGDGNPDVKYGEKDLDMQVMIDSLEKTADYSYVTRAKRQALTDTPGPGDGWGAPTIGFPETDPLSCKTHSVIHYETCDTYVQFEKGVAGCGLLLVEGDLEISGDFTWYGPIVVTGSVLFTGGGDKQITGAVLAGDSALVAGATGSTRIVYCTEAMEVLAEKRPLQLLSWKEGF